MGKMTKRRRVSTIRARDGEACCYCGMPMCFTATVGHRAATIEHVLSQSYGGTNYIRNLKLAHELCNVQIGDAPFFEKLMLMRWAGHTTQAQPRWAA